MISGIFYFYKENEELNVGTSFDNHNILEKITQRRLLKLQWDGGRFSMVPDLLSEIPSYTEGAYLFHFKSEPVFFECNNDPVTANDVRQSLSSLIQNEVTLRKFSFTRQL